jgi:hypothetical protein
MGRRAGRKHACGVQNEPVAAVPPLWFTAAGKLIWRMVAWFFSLYAYERKRRSETLRIIGQNSKTRPTEGRIGNILKKVGNVRPVLGSYGPGESKSRLE